MTNAGSLVGELLDSFVVGEAGAIVSPDAAELGIGGFVGAAVVGKFAGRTLMGLLEEGNGVSSGVVVSIAGVSIGSGAMGISFPDCLVGTGVGANVGKWVGTGVAGTVI